MVSHDLPGDRYWITSSAVANSVSGMVRPSALAVLRFRTISYFHRKLHREIARLRAAQDSIHIGGGATPVVFLVDSNGRT